MDKARRDGIGSVEEGWNQARRGGDQKAGMKFDKEKWDQLRRD
jgi:hypothetical protein